MNKESITSRQGITIIVMFLIGSTFVYASPKEAKQDAWMSIIVAAVLCVPLFVVYCRLIKLYPEKNLCEILEEVFGKPLGKLVTVLFCLYALFLGAVVVRNFTEFIRIVNFQETPPFIFEIIMAVICIYLVKSGVEVMGRWGGLILPILLVIVASTFFLLLNKMDFENLKPVLAEGARPVMQSAANLFAFPYADTVLLLMLLGSLKQGKKPFQVFYTGLGVFLLFFLFMFFRNTFVLGGFFSVTKYPPHAALGLVQAGNFIERVEIIFSLLLTFCGIMKVAVCLMAVSRGFSSVLELKDYRPMVMPFMLLMIVFSAVLFENSMEMFDFLKYYKFLAFPFQVILPVLAWIIAEIRNKISKKRTEPKMRSEPKYAGE